MLVYAQHSARDALQLQPSLDREATQLLAEKLFSEDLNDAWEVAAPMRQLLAKHSGRFGRH